MSGTVKGGQKAALSNIRNHGPDFYKRIGSKGGKRSRGGGFAAGEEGRKLARRWGAIGGRSSRRQPRR